MPVFPLVIFFEDGIRISITFDAFRPLAMKNVNGIHGQGLARVGMWGIQWHRSLLDE
jgi:hypothetical protein